MLNKDMERHRNIWDLFQGYVVNYSRPLRIMQRNLELSLADTYWLVRQTEGQDLQRTFGW